MMAEHDNVNHPAHYQNPGGIETIAMIENVLGLEGFLAYCWGNALKYICRWRNKGGTESLEKAVWYIRTMEKTEAKIKAVSMEKGIESEASD